MDEFLKTCGGFAGLGALIDLCLYPSVRKKLIQSMEDWWLRFSDVLWNNFGRKEAEAAIEILDRWAGPRLWSSKRWRFSLRICSGVFLAIILCFTIGRYIASGTLISGSEGQLLFAAVLFLTTIFTFALSLSATRFIAKAAAAASRNRASTIASFVSILASHVALFLYWSPVVAVVAITAMAFIWIPLALFNGGISPSWSAIWADYKESVREEIHFYEIWAASATLPNLETASFALVNGAFKLSMDVIANGVRIAFALAFLSSFVFQPLVQKPILSIWYGIMTSPKGFFTTLFTVVGALVGLGRWLL